MYIHSAKVAVVATYYSKNDEFDMYFGTDFYSIDLFWQYRRSVDYLKRPG